MHRVQIETDIKVSPLQGGFQKGIGCIMTSFLLRECAYFSKESGSKLYICCFDVKTAFDKVSHNGLFYKLYHLGVKLRSWKAIVSLHDNLQSRVLYKGFKSENFPVNIGTRQGGVSSPFLYLYLCFIDGLIRELESTYLGLSINGIHVPCTVSADDMTLLSLTKSGLDKMINICYNYSCKWGYEYNASKSAILVCNEPKRDQLNSTRSWCVGSDDIPEVDTYTHLGVSFDRNLSISGCLKDANNKLKSTLLSLDCCGVYENGGLHPLTSKKIYKSIVLPRGLYGCEMWYNMTKTNISLIEKSHRFCVKYIQSIGTRTRTHIALGLLGLYTMEAEIDKKKN